MEAYVGVDWSATAVVVSTTSDDRRPVGIRGTARTLEGVRELMGRVLKRHPEAQEVHVFIEAGAPGWVQMFHEAGAVVHVLDPKQVKHFADSLSSSGAKDDRRDSAVITLMGWERCARLPIWTPDSESRTELKRLSALHETLTKQATAAKQRLRAQLREDFPRLEAVLPDLSSKWVRTLLGLFPTAYHAQGLTRSEFATQMKGCGASKKKLGLAFEALQKSETPWMTANLAEVYAVSVHALLEQLVLFTTQLKAVEARLDEATAEMEIRHLFESVGGVGVKMTNRILELAIDPEAPPSNRDEASRQLGASPVFRGSAKTKKGQLKGHSRMRKSVSGRCRQTAYLLGRLASQQLSWAKARYAWDRAHGKSAANSYRIIARSLLRILTAMARDGETYDEARYVALLQKQGLPWAMDLEA